MRLIGIATLVCIGAGSIVQIALADDCGQSGGQGSLLSAIRAAKESKERHCSDTEKQRRLAGQSNQCNTKNGPRDAVEGAEAYVQKLKEVCEAAGRAEEAAQKACADNKEAERLAEVLKRRIAALTEKEKEDLTAVQAALQAPKSELKKQLEAAAKSAKEAAEAAKLEGKPEEAKAAAKKLDQLAKAQAQRRQEAVAKAQQEWRACPTRACDEQAKRKWQEANQEKNKGQMDCRSMLASRDGLENEREDLVKKVKQVANASNGLGQEATAKAGATERNISQTGERVKNMNSVDPKAPSTITGGSDKQSPTMEDLKKMSKEDRRKYFADAVEPHARAAAELLVPSQVTDRQAKVDEATRAITAQWAMESNYCNNRGCLSSDNNASGLGGMRGSYADFNDFATRGGNPMTMPASQGYPGYAGYLTPDPSRGWTGYNNARDSLGSGNTQQFFQRIGDGGFSSICKGACYTDKVSSVYTRIYGRSPPRTGSSSPVDFANASGTGGKGADPKGLAPDHAARIISPAMARAIAAGEALSSFGEGLPGPRFASSSSLASDPKAVKIANNESAQREAPSVGGLFFAEPSSPMGIELEATILIEAAKGEHEAPRFPAEAETNTTGNRASQVRFTGEMSGQLASDILRVAGAEESLFRLVSRRYQLTEQFRKARANKAPTAAMEARLSR
jgi:hypothetical protein